MGDATRTTRGDEAPLRRGILSNWLASSSCWPPSPGGRGAYIFGSVVARRINGRVPGPSGRDGRWTGSERGAKNDESLSGKYRRSEGAGGLLQFGEGAFVLSACRVSFAAVADCYGCHRQVPLQPQIRLFAGWWH